MTINNPMDAAESVAGHDFHIVWAILKCLKLINFDPNDLKAISIENLSKEDQSTIDTSGGMSLGVDLTEYYGASDFSNSTKVVVSQLKYSTKSPDKKWTAASICAGKKGTDGSIIHRLGSFYERFSSQNDRNDIRTKLRIKIVSNRPIDQKLKNLVDSVSRLCNSKPKKQFGITDVKKIIDPKFLTDFGRLQKAAKLNSCEFVDFLSLLDFSDCGNGSRFKLEQQVIKAISSLTPFKSTVEYSSLHKLIWGKMMPEQKQENTIALSDVLLTFGFNDISDIFPVKNEIRSPTTLVMRDQLDDIKDLFKDDDQPLICIHGGAGIGKSTFVNMIPAVFPIHSQSVIFDCYGGGTYLDPDDKRHKHSTGILQLCNELALLTSSSLLLVREGSEEFFLRQFKERVKSAVQIIRSLNPTAIVAIIIDAADNSVTASNLYGNNAFVKDLVRMEFEVGCKIIISARTERLDTLNLPEDTKFIEILPFSKVETKVYLEPAYGLVEDAQIEEFRSLTNSIPRVMSYALELPGSSLADKIIPLKPNGKTLDQIFRLRIKEAEKRATKKDVSQLLKTLIALPRPVPLSLVCALTKLSTKGIDDIQIDLWREIIFTNSEFSFRDEDFETYLRKNYSLIISDFQNIADKLIEKADQDEYSSLHLGNFLNKANRWQTLKEIVINREFLRYPLDTVKNKEVFIERSKLALKNASSELCPADAIKLITVSAEASKTNQVLEDILLNQPELASKYGNLQSNQKLYFQTGNPRWFGRIHYRNAAIYSKNKATWNLAKAHLTKAREWVNFRSKLNEDELNDYELTPIDLAYGAEAILNLEGANKAVEWITEWKPRRALYKVAERLIINLISDGNLLHATKWLKANETKIRIDLKLRLTSIYFERGLKQPFSIMSLIKDAKVLEKLDLHEKVRINASLISFAELAIKSKIEYSKIKPFLDLISINELAHAPSFYSNYDNELERIDIQLRKAAIKKHFENGSFIVKDFYSKKLQLDFESKDQKIRSNVEDKVKSFERIFSHLLPVYMLRSTYLFKRMPSKQINKKLDEILSNLDRDWELNYYQRHDSKGLRKFMLQKVLDIAFHQSNNALVVHFDSLIKSNTFKSASLLLSICETLTKKSNHSNYLLPILKSAELLTENSKLSGKELIDDYTRAALIANTFSEEYGKYYFDKMVAASNEIDFEAFDQIRSISDFVEGRPAFKNPEMAKKFFRYTEYCSEKMSNWDGFPWHVIMSTATKLDVATAFAGICQWDHRGVKPISEYQLDLITAALEQDFIAADVGTALLGMNKYYYNSLQEYYKILVEKLNKTNDNQLKNAALNQIIRDLKLHRPSKNHTQFLRSFLELIKDGRFTDRKIVDEFSLYISELELILDPTVKEEREKEAKTFKAPTYKKYISNLKNVDRDIFSELSNKIKKGERKDYINFQRLFEEISAIAKPIDYVTYLDGVVEIGEIGVCYSDFENGLAKFLGDWKDHQNVKKWMANAFTKIVNSWFKIFVDDDYVSIDTLEKLSGILGLSEADFAIACLNLVSGNLDEFSSRGLYQLLNAIYPLLRQEEREPILDWILDRCTEKVPVDFVEFLDKDNVLKERNSIEIVSYFMRYNLGHPKKAVRWITAHVIRRLVELGDTQILTRLLEMQDETTCNVFQEKSYTFFWLSAKLYLWIAIERISKEDPIKLVALKKFIVAEINNERLPHAQVRHFVKSTAMALKSYDPRLFTTAECLQLDNCLTSPFPKGKKNDDYSQHSPRPELKFHFDTMDTLPYWYAPLARLFKVSQYDVAEIADKYISEYWGYTGDTRKDDHVKSNRYEDTSNRHGSEPRLENLSSYFEYHGMFCAATELLQTKPLIVGEYSSENEFDEWIKGWGLCWDNFWISDFNDPVPLEKRLWINKREGISDWEWEIAPSDFDNYLHPNIENTIAIHSAIKIYFGKDYESSSLRSCLVDQKTGHALLRTFQTRSASDNHIPFENEYDYGGEETIKRKKLYPKFNYTSWLWEEKTEPEGIDDNDPLFKGISTARIRPGTSFLQWSQAQITSDFRTSYDSGQSMEDWHTQLESWSDYNERNNYSDFMTTGTRLIIKKDSLKAFLNHVKKDLLVKIELYRRVDRRDHKYYPPYNLVYLLTADGKIRTLTGNDSTW